jgi:hypothetical protein
MKSPFPGMDPYIEASRLWGDFHDKLIGDIERALAAAVPERYVVRLGLREYIVLVGTEGKEDHAFVPDVRVVSPPARKGQNRLSGGAALAEPQPFASPVAMRPFIEEEFRENFIEIRDTEDDHRLITCIEILSPSNKVRGSDGREVYLRKRQALLLGEANLVEIDLLRGGQRMPMLDPWPSSPYTILVSRMRSFVPRCLVWQATFREPLPVVPVPLLKPDPDIPLDMRPMIEAIYARSRYETSIDYGRPLDPPLDAEQAAWVEARLAEIRSERRPAPGKRRRQRPAP